MDRKTGFAKGYALIEYADFEEATNAIRDMNGQEIYEKQVRVDWAFQEKPLQEKRRPK
jgi:RNA-binding protein 8A